MSAFSYIIKHQSTKAGGETTSFRGSGETEGFLLILQQMLTDDSRSKIENITAGAILKGQQDSCTTARNLLCGSYHTTTALSMVSKTQSPYI
jgi:hypothetical protein